MAARSAIVSFMQGRGQIDVSQAFVLNEGGDQSWVSSMTSMTWLACHLAG
jgi:hypothetical protein